MFWEHRAEIEVLFFLFYRRRSSEGDACFSQWSYVLSSVTHFGQCFWPKSYPPPLSLAAFAPQYDGHPFGDPDFHGTVMTHKFLAPAPDEPPPVACAG